MTIRVLSSFLTLVLLTLSSTAAEIGIRTLALDGGKIPEHFVKGNGGFTLLTFSKIQPSAPFKATLTDPLALYVADESPNSVGAYAVGSKVGLPAGATNILLVSMTSGKKVRFIALKDDIAAAGSKDWMLINSTTKPIAFQVGDEEKPILLEPGKTKSYRITAADGKGTSVSAKAKYGEKVKTIYSTYWPINSGKRSLVLFMEIDGKIRVKRIADKVGK